MARTHVVSAEEAVSRYLTFLGQPAMFSDTAAEHALHDFIALAKGWADAGESIGLCLPCPRSPEDVLLAAGIVEEQRLGGRVINVPGF